MEEFVTYENKDQRRMGRAESECVGPGLSLTFSNLGARWWHCCEKVSPVNKTEDNAELWGGREVSSGLHRARERGASVRRVWDEIPTQPLIHGLQWSPPFTPLFPQLMKGDDISTWQGCLERKVMCLAPNTTFKPRVGTWYIETILILRPRIILI